MQPYVLRACLTTPFIADTVGHIPDPLPEQPGQLRVADAVL